MPDGQQRHRNHYHSPLQDHEGHLIIRQLAVEPLA